MIKWDPWTISNVSMSVTSMYAREGGGVGGECEMWKMINEFYTSHNMWFHIMKEPTKEILLGSARLDSARYMRTTLRTYVRSCCYLSF